MPRNNFTKTTKREAFKRASGICECHLIPHVFENPCRQPFDSKGIRYEHIDPDAISKRNDLENCAVLRFECWDFKTNRYDKQVIAKSNRVQDRARGIKRRPKGRPMPGSRASGLKVKLDGSIVDRRTGRVIKEARR